MYVVVCACCVASWWAYTRDRACNFIISASTDAITLLCYMRVNYVQVSLHPITINLCCPCVTFLENSTANKIQAEKSPIPTIQFITTIHTIQGYSCKVCMCQYTWTVMHKSYMELQIKCHLSTPIPTLLMNPIIDRQYPIVRQSKHHKSNICTLHNLLVVNAIRTYHIPQQVFGVSLMLRGSCLRLPPPRSPPRPSHTVG